jgi:hypothetical protein
MNPVYYIAQGSGAEAVYEGYMKPFLAKYDNNVDVLLRDVFVSIQNIHHSRVVQFALTLVSNLTGGHPQKPASTVTPVAQATPVGDKKAE